MQSRLLAIAALVVLAFPASAAAHRSGHAKVGFNVFSSPIAAPVGLASGAEYLSGDNGFTGGHVAFEGDRLYLGSYGRGMHIYDISDPAAPERIGEYIPGGPRADAPPDAGVFDGRHIAVLNGTNRTHGSLPSDLRTDRTEFLDVTDPAQPRLLHTFGPDRVDGESHNGDIVDSRRLYFPSGLGGDQGLRIYDLRPLIDDDAPPKNIFRGNPTKMWEASPYRDGREVGAPFTHTHDISIYTDLRVRGRKRDIALLAEGGNYTGSGDTGSVFVIDVTRPAKPVVLFRWLHGEEEGGDHHPIRYHHEAQLLDGDPSVMLVTDEDMHNGCGGAGGVVAVKLAPDMRSGKELSEWFIPLGTPAPVCSVHVFTSEGSKAFFGAYNAGMQVVDYSDPSNPEQVGQYIAEGATSWGAYYRNGYVYMGDMSRGLDVLRWDGS